jgi:hypothetical protein
MTNVKMQSDMEVAKYLLETVAPNLREAGQTDTANDVEDAGHRLSASSEVRDALLAAETKWRKAKYPMEDKTDG